MQLPSGLYEQLIDNRIRDILAQYPLAQYVAAEVDAGDRHDMLATYLQHVIAAALRRCSGPDAERMQLDILNRILRLLAEATGDAPPATLATAQQLLEFRESPLSPPTPRPDTPLSHSCLLARTNLDPTLLSQLKKEILSARRSTSSVPSSNGADCAA